MSDTIERLRRLYDYIRASEDEPPTRLPSEAFRLCASQLDSIIEYAESAPIPVILYCPNCGVQHIDDAEPESGWTNPPHRSHLCHACGVIWRPADVPTTGVASIETEGKDDTWPTDPEEVRAMPAREFRSLRQIQDTYTPKRLAALDRAREAAAIDWGAPSQAEALEDAIDEMFPLPNGWDERTRLTVFDGKLIVCYKGKQKRRPRAEWVIQEATHPALISQGEAELLFERLENSDIGRRVSEAKTGTSDYLLTGVLMAPDGRQWTGYRQTQYRLKAAKGEPGRYVAAAPVDDAVMEQLLKDLRSPTFVRGMVEKAREHAIAEDPAEELREEAAALTRQVEKATDLAMQLEDPAPMLRKVDDLERRRRVLADEIQRLERDYSMQAALANVTEKQVSELLGGLAEEMAENPKAKQLLRTFIERVELDPTTGHCEIRYRVNVSDSLSVASPSEGDGWAALIAVSRRFRLRLVA